ncbi:hypothetical protein Tco_0388640 [Tanacetum coccineum]
MPFYLSARITKAENVSWVRRCRHSLLVEFLVRYFIASRYEAMIPSIGETVFAYDMRYCQVIMEYLVKVSKRRAFWSLNEDILKIIDSDYQYAVSIKEDTAYPCLHSPKTTKETRSIRRIQRRPIRRIGDIVCEDSGRYQAWSLLQETPQYAISNPLDTPYRHRLQTV